MSQARLHDTGEEFIITTGLGTQTFTVGLFNKAQDDLSDSDDIGDITTEPNGSNYSRVTADFEPSDYSGAFTDDWGFTNINDITIDVSDSTNKIDSYFIATSFQSQDKGDSSSQLHLISTGYLKDTRNLNDGERQVVSINLPANTIGVRLGPRLDGDKLFHVDFTAGTDGILYTEEISSFDISSTTRLSDEELVSGVDEYYVEFDITGFKMLITRSDGQVNQYILKQRYDPTTRELDATVSLSGGGDVWTAIWNNDGTKLYEQGSPDSLYQHTVDDVFDATTISNSTLIDDDLTQTPKGACWNDDGTKYYYVGQFTKSGSFKQLDDVVVTFTLSTPWDLTTITNTESRGRFFSFNEDGNVGSDAGTSRNYDSHTGIRFNYNGTKFYVADETVHGPASDAGRIAEVELSTPFDISTDTNTTVYSFNDDKVLGFTLNTLPKYLGAG